MYCDHETCMLIMIADHETCILIMIAITMVEVSALACCCAKCSHNNFNYILKLTEYQRRQSWGFGCCNPNMGSQPQDWCRW